MHAASPSHFRLGALIRPVSPSIVNCQLTFMERCLVNYELACRQHASYVNALHRLGVTVVALPIEPNLPDATFVEDVALVFGEVAVLTSPSIPRRSETPSVMPVIECYRPTTTICDAAMLEGGDVIRRDRTIYVGQSRRTDRAGFESLRDIVRPYGYSVVPVPVHSCLHLSTGASYLGEDTFLINPYWIDHANFQNCRVLTVPDDEPWAANVLRIDGSLIIPAAFPRTSEMLARLGYSLESLDCSELMKAEAGVTCMSITFELEP